MAAGMNLDDVVKTTIYVKDLNHFADVNRIYEGFFSKNPPARVCVEISRLPKDALIDIEAIACKTDGEATAR
jgi:2-iminobutanoate/2-iminopropanoate deaminase